MRLGNIKVLRRPLLKGEIEAAYKVSDCAADAARHLGVSSITFKKYAQLYGIYKTNPNRFGIHREYGPEAGQYPLSELLEGKHLNYPLYRFRRKLIKAGIKKEECELCGFHERRILDDQIPLLINFKDGDKKNRKLENIQILCFNCMFLTSAKLPPAFEFKVSEGKVQQTSMPSQKPAEQAPSQP